MSGGVAHAAAIACKHTVVDSELSTSVDQTQSQPTPLATVIQKKIVIFVVISIIRDATAPHVK